MTSVIIIAGNKTIFRELQCGKENVPRVITKCNLRIYVKRSGVTKIITKYIFLCFCTSALISAKKPSRNRSIYKLDGNVNII